jgi:enoyl-CoA hydratase/carnithine racemase
MTAGDEALVRVELGSGLAVLTIDAPPLNLYTAELQEQLSAAIGLLERDKPRAALIRAEGTIVSGGVDVSLFDARAMWPKPKRSSTSCCRCPTGSPRSRSPLSSPPTGCV